VFLAALVVTLAALFAPGWIGAVLLVLAVAFLAVIMRRTWPVAQTSTRVTRVLVLAVLLFFAGWKATH